MSNNETTPLQTIAVTATDPAKRLDHFLIPHLPEFSRSKIQNLISTGHIFINGKPAKNNSPISPGDRIEVSLPPPKPSALQPQEIPLHFYFDDPHLCVLEKPAGLVVHPGAGNQDGTLVHALLHHFGAAFLQAGGINGEARPGIVHRIDKNTSGILVVAKDQQTHQDLCEQFKAHSIMRLYEGVCWGRLPENGEWITQIGRDPKDRIKMTVLPQGGKRAHTSFQRKQLFSSIASHFEARLFTGRTHQIRVHFAHFGFPLWGDQTYDSPKQQGRNLRLEGEKALQKTGGEVIEKIQELRETKRQFLHAKYLKFQHPRTGTTLEFQSPLPTELQQLLNLAKQWIK